MAESAAGSDLRSGLPGRALREDAAEGRVENRAVYVAIGIDLEGRKEVLGLWTSGNEGAKFWLGVLTELRNRGVKDILIACVDGLKGFPQAIETVFHWAPGRVALDPGESRPPSRRSGCVSAEPYSSARVQPV
jgi:hypothetical protein